MCKQNHGSMASYTGSKHNYIINGANMPARLSDCYSLYSLVPRPHPRKNSGLVSTVRACANKLLNGKRSVKVSVNDISHMARSSTEAVYAYSKRRIRNQP